MRRGPVVLFIAVLALPACESTSDSGGSGDSSSEEITGSKADAFEVCKRFVKRQLKAPDTAKFRNFYQDDGEVNVEGTGNGPYTVVSSVDSENSFGAKLRSSFVCKVTLDGDSWNLDDMQFIDGGDIGL